MPRSGSHGLGPEQAQRIAKECYGEVLAYCRRHAPAGYEPADLAQETFLRFVRAGSYREQGRPIAYLMRIARSVCVDASRKRRLETVPLDFDIAESGETGGDDAIDEALAKLSEDLREVVELRFGSGLGVGEVAHVLGISRFAARRRIDTALKLLAEELEDGDLNG